MNDADLHRWFQEAVLPNEAMLVRFIRRNWPYADDIIDIRQDVYEHVLIGAKRSIPITPRAYLLTIARNILLNRARRAKIVSFDLVADLEELDCLAEGYDAENRFVARDQLRRAEAGLDRLPPRCREVVRLRKLEGMSTREVAAHLGVGHHTVERQLTLGMRALVDFMLGGEGRIVRKTAAVPPREEAGHE